MKPIVYLKGDATHPQGGNPKIIAHVCNDIGGWGKGFVLALSQRSSKPEQAYRQWYQERGQNDFFLGAVQFVQIAPDIWVANMIGQHRIKSENSIPPIRYEAIEKALSKVAQKAQQMGASVHMPRIGCGLAGGDWKQIEPLIRKELSEREIEVYVYDLS